MIFTKHYNNALEKLRLTKKSKEKGNPTRVHMSTDPEIIGVKSIREDIHFHPKIQGKNYTKNHLLLLGLLL